MKTDDDRGAVLFILILFLVIFIAVATLALDLAAKGERGQDLQNTSDAAALAGVVEYQEYLLDNPLDFAGAEAAAQIVVEQVMAQNGIDPNGTNPDGSDNIDVQIEAFENGTQLQVRITDSNPDQFLPTDLLGEAIKVGDPSVTRSATAEFLACENECNLTVEIQKSFGAVNARGDGDGYKPVLVNQKLYAINHNSNDRNIVCISIVTQEPCWADGVFRPAYSTSVGFFSPNPEMPQTAVVGSRIYWAATDKSNGHRLFCWETAAGLDVPCPTAVTLNSGLDRFDNRDDDNTLTNFKDENRGGGTFTVFGNKVFSFTDDHRIHCWEPASSAICSGYSNGGNPTSLGAADFPASSPVHGNHGSSIDRIVDETTGRVYSTLHIPFAQTVDCSSPLVPGLNVAGDQVVVVNKEGRYLASEFPDDVSAADDGATPAARWDASNFEGDLTLQSANHGEYLDADFFVGTSTTLGDDDRWSVPLTDNNDAYWLNSAVAGTIVDVGGIIEEGDEEPFGALGAEWNFFPWECGVDPDRVDPGPDYFMSGTWLHCYDTGVITGFEGPCPGFTVNGTAGVAAGTPSPIHADGTRFSGRLWFYHGASPGDGLEAPKLGVCSSGYSTWNDPADDNNLDPDSIEVSCVSIDNGSFSGSMSTDMNNVEGLIQNFTGSDPGAWGDPHWNSQENRLFYPTEHDTSRIICHDFNDNSPCGDITGTVPPNPDGVVFTEDYGFISDENCVYALGHTAFFWAFKADDIEEPCDATIPPTKIERCPCGEGLTFRWGELDFGNIDLSLFDAFGVRIGTDDGADGSASIPIFPSDGSFVSIKPGGGELKIPLDSLAIPDGAESVLVFFDIQGLDEDLIEEAGDFEIRFAQRPRLVD